MFRNGQFGQGHVFMEDLLSQPVQIDQPEPAQMPAIQMPMIQQAAPQQDNGMSGLGQGIGSLLGLGGAGLAKYFSGKGGSGGGDSYTQDPNFGGGSSLNSSDVANLTSRGFNMNMTSNPAGFAASPPAGGGGNSFSQAELANLLSRGFQPQ